jgi:hypothetical protein
MTIAPSAEDADVERGSLSQASRSVGEAGAHFGYWIAVVFAVGSFIGGIVALVHLSFVGVLGGFVMGGFWSLSAYVMRQHRAGIRSRGPNQQ